VDVVVLHTPSAARLQTTRILLADDSTVERLAVAHFLRREGYDVDEADDGRSAIEHLRNRTIDLLLLDLQMPGVDGFDVLAYVQHNRPGLPVVLISGLAPDQIQGQIRFLPRPELPPLLIKPVDLDQLLQLIDMQINGTLPRTSAD